MKKIRMVALFVCTAVILSLFSGCGKETDIKTIQKGPEEDGAYKITDKPLELTFFYGYLGGPFKDDYPVFQEASRLTNIKLKGTVPQSTSDATQTFNTMMATGELDDIVSASKTDFDKYAGKKAFTPLNDLINEYAPNIKKYLEEHPDVKRGITSSDGNIYFIPKIEDGIAAKGWYIRKDWLDKLGLEVPKTVDDFYNVLKAFKERDPNGNGKQDEVPYFDRGNNLDSLYNLFGIRSGFSVDEKTGKIVYSKFVPEYKTAIAALAKWYKAGIIDNELFTRDDSIREVLLGDNLGGATHDWFTSTSSYNDKLAGKIPGFNLVPIVPPADINGKVWEDTSRTSSFRFGWGISMRNKHQVETIKYFDWWFTEAGKRMFNYGIEGVHYEMIDGKPKFFPSFVEGDKSMNTVLWGEGMLLGIGGQQDIECEKLWMTEGAIQGMNLYLDGNYILTKLPELPFTQEERKILTEKWTVIESYVNEKEQKWLFGNEDVNNTFDTYINECKKMGMDEVLEVYNTAYARYQSN